MMCTFKRISIIALFTLFSVSLLFAADDVKRITAYKQAKIDEYPIRSVSVRCLTAVGEDIAQGDSIILSEDFRYDSLPGFSWICSGNAFGNVTVTFTFGQMVHSEAKTNNLIYYTVSMSHSETRIGNSSVVNKKTPSADDGLKRVFPEDATSGTRFAIIYADNATVPASFKVTTAAQEKAVTYDFTTYSKIYRRTGTDTTTLVDTVSDASTYKTAFSSSDTRMQNVCEFWNRYGTVSIELDVTAKQEGDTTVYYTNSGNTKCEYGWYSADVSIAVVSE